MTFYVYAPAPGPGRLLETCERAQDARAARVRYLNTGLAVSITTVNAWGESPEAAIERAAWAAAAAVGRPRKRGRPDFAVPAAPAAGQKTPGLKSSTGKRPGKTARGRTPRSR